MSVRPAALVLALSLACTPAQARGPDVQRPHIEAAAVRFGLPADLIAEVIRVESNGQVGAVSRAGAMGLMQLMPGTWAALRDRLALGADPFDPRDNVLAGAAYLRQLLDRYGAPGFLAAYNAGPGRYEESLAGRPLPSETLRYVERLSGLSAHEAHPLDWREAGLFASPWPGDLGQAPTAAIVGDKAETGLFAPRRSPGS